MEGGLATFPTNLVSPPSTTFPMKHPQPLVQPNWGRNPEVAAGLEPVFASHLSIKSLTLVHELPQYIVVEESLLPPPQPNPVGPDSPPLSPRQGAYIKYLNGIPYLIRPSHGEGSGGGAFL